MAFRSIAGDHQAVEPEELGDVGLVTGEIVIEGLLRRHAGFLQLDHDERQSIHESDKVRPPRIKGAGHAELTDEQKIIGERIVPIDDANPFRLLAAARGIRNSHFDAVFEQPVHLPIRRYQAHGRSVTGQLVDGLGECFWRERGIEAFERGTETREKNRFPLGFSTERTAQAKDLLGSGENLPAQGCEKMHGRLFDKLIF